MDAHLVKGKPVHSWEYVAFLLIVILLNSVLLIDIYVSDDDINNFFRRKGWNIIDRIIFGDHYDDEEQYNHYSQIGLLLPSGTNYS